MRSRAKPFGLSRLVRSLAIAGSHARLRFPLAAARRRNLALASARKPSRLPPQTVITLRRIRKQVAFAQTVATKPGATRLLPGSSAASLKKPVKTWHKLEPGSALKQSSSVELYDDDSKENSSSRERNEKDIRPFHAAPRASSQHTNLTTFLDYARRTGLSPTSPVYKGTFYEYAVSTALLPFGIVLKRVGGSNDGGIDLWGRWWQDFESRLPGHTNRLAASDPSTSSNQNGFAGERKWAYIAVQCKTLGQKGSPALLRELEGALATFKARSRISHSNVPILGLLVTTQPSSAGVRAALGRSSIPLGFVCVPFMSDSTIPNSESEKEFEVVQFTWNAAATRELGLQRVGVVVQHPAYYSLRYSSSVTGNGRASNQTFERPRGRLVLTLDSKPLVPCHNVPDLEPNLLSLEALAASTSLIKASNSLAEELAKLQRRIIGVKTLVQDSIALDAFTLESNEKHEISESIPFVEEETLEAQPELCLSHKSISFHSQVTQSSYKKEKPTEDINFEGMMKELGASSGTADSVISSTASDKFEKKLSKGNDDILDRNVAAEKSHHRSSTPVVIADPFEAIMEPLVNSPSAVPSAQRKIRTTKEKTKYNPELELTEGKLSEFDGSSGNEQDYGSATVLEDNKPDSSMTQLNHKLFRLISDLQKKSKELRPLVREIKALVAQRSVARMLSHSEKERAAALEAPNNVPAPASSSLLEQQKHLGIAAEATQIGSDGKEQSEKNHAKKHEKEEKKEKDKENGNIADHRTMPTKKRGRPPKKKVLDTEKQGGDLITNLAANTEKCDIRVAQEHLHKQGM